MSLSPILKMHQLAIRIIVLLILPITAQSAEVKNVKGKKVLIDMQNDIFTVGDILKIESASGKTIGLIKVKKVKNNLAEGLYKGRAEKGLTVKLRPKNNGTPTDSDTAQSKSNSSATFGAMIGFNSSSADVTLPIEESVTLDGNGFSAKVVMDYTLMQWLGFRGMAGMEQFNVGGANNTETLAAGGCAGECTIDITYLTLDLWGRFIMGSHYIRPWLGGGINLLFPMTKETTALDEESITSTSVFAVGGGIDWWLSDNSYFPIQLEYGLYPSSDNVSAHAIALRVGFLKSF